MVEGRKVAGSAQTRQKGVILQHGSILLDLNSEKLFDLFIYQNERLKERMFKNFRDKAVAINDLSNRTVTIEEAKNAFKLGFAEGLEIELEEYQLSDNQHAEIIKLSKEKYESKDWNFMR